MFRILAITATLLAASAAAHADVYRITDAQGHVQYTDRWVPGSVLVKTTSSTAHGAPGTPPPAQQDSLAATNARIAEQQSQAESERTVKQDVAKTKEQRCKEATEKYQKSIQARRIFKEDKDGKREYVSDTEADAYRVQMLNARKDACGK